MDTFVAANGIAECSRRGMFAEVLPSLKLKRFKNSCNKQPGRYNSEEIRWVSLKGMGPIRANPRNNLPLSASLWIDFQQLAELVMKPEIVLRLIPVAPILGASGGPFGDDTVSWFAGKKPARKHSIWGRSIECKEARSHSAWQPIIEWPVAV